jgi:hypothetical protein
VILRRADQRAQHPKRPPRLLGRQEAPFTERHDDRGGGEEGNLLCTQKGQKPPIVAQDSIGVGAHVEVEGFALPCAQGDALDYLGDAWMPRWWGVLHVGLDEGFKRHRVCIASGFALGHRFAPDGRADEELGVLSEDG